MTTPTPTPTKTAPPSAAQVCARVQIALARQRREVPGPLVRQPAPGVPADRSKSVGCEPAARLAAILHNAALDLWDVATEPRADVGGSPRYRQPHPRRLPLCLVAHLTLVPVTVGYEWARRLSR